MPKTLINGAGLHYQYRLGSGPHLVLVHGLAANLAFWYFRIAALLPRDYSLIMYDLRGHGQSEMPPSGYTTGDMAADLHGLLEHLNVRRVHVVGHSYGGAVALHYTVLHPERVVSLSLADTRIMALQPTQRLSDWPDAKKWISVLKELEPPIALDDPEMGFRLLEILAEAKLDRRVGMRMPAGQFSPFGLGNRSSRTAERWLQLVRTTTARSDVSSLAGLTLAKIQQADRPVLAMFGEYTNCMPSCQGLRQHLPNCRAIIVPQAGHFHPVVRPAFFARNLCEFLREVAA